MKIFIILLLSVFGIVLIIYVSMWIFSIKKYPIEYGISFNQNHAQYLGLDWKQVYLDMLSELKPKYVRIASMWSEVELEKGTYDFTNVDWMMDRAMEKGVKVVLVVGQKAPRWPECHVPIWTQTISKAEYDQKLLSYVRTVVERYQNHSALEIWQIENEPYIRFRFGDCQNFDSTLLTKEIAIVKKLDLNHKILITDSGELSTWRRAHRAGDLFGTTMYRVVRTPQQWVFTYDWLPAGFYRYKALLWGLKPVDVFVAELQAEPWLLRRMRLIHLFQSKEKR
ncbi:MAG: beta-galactosidase [Patescibacteria group bacterium]